MKAKIKKRGSVKIIELGWWEKNGFIEINRIIVDW